MRIVVTGREGQVARSLSEIGPGRGHEIVPLGRPTLDLLDPATIGPAIRAARPDAVINAGAYTAVDRAETEPEIAEAVNGRGAGVVAEVARDLGVPILQVSTDYVFDGTKPTPYVENDPTGPLGAYGRSKLLGEHLVAEANPRHAILRTAWVYAPFGANFVRTMLRLAATRDEVGVVADQLGCPTSALDIAATLDRRGRAHGGRARRPRRCRAPSTWRRAAMRSGPTWPRPPSRLPGRGAGRARG